jgi:hypothetical protein
MKLVSLFTPISHLQITHHENLLLPTARLREVGYFLKKILTIKSWRFVVKMVIALTEII